MKETFLYTYNNISPLNYVKQYLLNSDVDKALADANDCGLKKWYYNREDKCSIRFSITVHWTEPISHIVGSEELTISVKRIFKLDENPIQVNSVIRTSFKYISATILSTFQDNAGSCVEERTIEVNYSGGTLKEQIELDFFNAILPLFNPSSLILASNEAKNDNDENMNCVENVGNNENDQTDVNINANAENDNNNNNLNGLNGTIEVNKKVKKSAAKVQDFQCYHFMHEKLQELKESSLVYSEIIEKSQFKRPSLAIPSAEQIARVVEIAEPSNFSIQGELLQLRAEADRTLRIVGQIRRARLQNASASSLPLFVLASCAAMVALIVSRAP